MLATSGRKRQSCKESSTVKYLCLNFGYADLVTVPACKTRINGFDGGVQ